VIYNVVCEICYDREYIYPCFLEVFGELTSDIYGSGGTVGSGAVKVNGIKSDCMAIFEWSLLRRLDFIRFNELYLTCVIRDKYTEIVKHRTRWAFDISTGELISELQEEIP